jgi:hypothetical protein
MRKLAFGLVMATMACGSGDGPTPPDPQVSSIIVSIDVSTIIAGTTEQASASAFDAQGRALPGTPFEWSSTNTAVASVSNTGLVTGVAPGTAIIRASAGGVTGSRNISVDVDRCETPLVLAPGQVATLSGPNAVSCLVIASVPNESEYLFIPANGTAAPDDIRTYSVQGDVATAAARAQSSLNLGEAASSAGLPALAQRAPLAGHILADGQRIMSVVPRARRTDRTRFRREREAARLGAQAAVLTASATVGDSVNLNVTTANSSNLCTTFAAIRGVVKAIGTHAIIVEDITTPTGGFSPADYSDIAAEFDNLIYPTDVAWFGQPTDIDGDGKIVILFTPEVNKLTPASTDGGFTGGFFWPGDLFLKTDFPTDSPCPATNEREIFYLLAADPAGTFGNVRTTSSVRQASRGTIAHEFQHMINQGVRQFNPAVDSLEVPWLNEAMSHIAEEAVGRAQLGLGDFVELDYAAITANQQDFVAYFVQNLLRYRSWMQRPDTSSPISNRAANQLAPRGAGWSLLRYTADQYANNNAKQFFRALAAGPTVNVTNFVSKAGVPFDEIDAGWLVANYTDNLNVAGLDSRYAFRSWDMHDVMAGSNQDVFPLLVKPFPTQEETKSFSGSGNFYRLVRPAGSGQATFRMLSTTGGTVSFSGARLHVVRIR